VRFADQVRCLSLWLEKNMKLQFVGLLGALILCLTFITEQSIAQSSQPPKRFSYLSLTPYNPKRVGYESLPVRVIGAGGGKLGPNEKFEIFASWLKNETSKEVKAARFSYYIFKSDNLDHAIHTGQTAVIDLDLPAFEQRKVRIHVVDVDDIPSLAYKQGEEFRLEVAITEVHYIDGSIWQVTDLPGEMNLVKAP
jgi:hypothetical protein